MHHSFPPVHSRPAPTVITDQAFDHECGEVVPESPTLSTLCFPIAGHYCIFDGRLGHGVLDSGEGASLRATLLVNWWQHKPQAVDRTPGGCRPERPFQPAQAQPPTATGAPRRLDVPVVAVPASKLDGPDGLLPVRPSEGALPRLARDGVVCRETEDWAEMARCRPAAHARPEQSSRDRCRLPAHTALQVDFVLEDAGIKLAGPGSVDGVTLRHPGLVLSAMETEGTPFVVGALLGLPYDDEGSDSETSNA